MQKQRKLVAWSPHEHNRVVVGSGSDLRLVDINLGDNARSAFGSRAASHHHHQQQQRFVLEPPPAAAVQQDQQQQQMRTPAMSVLSVNSEVQQQKCLAWCPRAAALSGGGGEWRQLVPDPADLVACGLPSGKVVLARTRPGTARVVREFVPRHSRSCNALAWNPHFDNLIAAGFDKVRGDFSVIIWDVNTASVPPPAAATASSSLAVPSSAASAVSTPAAVGGAARGGGGPAGGSSAMQQLQQPQPLRSSSVAASVVSGRSSPQPPPDPQQQQQQQAPPPPSVSPGAGADGGGGGGLLSTGGGSVVSVPYAELANAESTVALAWLPEMPHVLLTGTQVKWLRLYDLRQQQHGSGPSAPQSVVAHSRSVLGVCVEPLAPWRLATFSEDGLIKLWDVRRLQSPQCVLQSGARRLAQIDWCPSRPAMLAAISSDERLVRVWHLNDVVNQQPLSQQLPSSQDKSVAAAAALSSSASGGPAGPAAAADRGGGGAEPAALWLKPARVHECVDVPASFAWAPAGASSGPALLTVGSSQSGGLEFARFNEPVVVARAATGALAFALGSTLVEAPPPLQLQQQHHPQQQSPQAPPAAPLSGSSSGGGHMGSDHQQHQHQQQKPAAAAAATHPPPRAMVGAASVDISDVMLRRAQLGYSMEISHNVRLLRDAVRHAAPALSTSHPAQAAAAAAAAAIASPPPPPPPLALPGPDPGSAEQLLQLWSWLADSRASSRESTTVPSGSPAAVTAPPVPMTAAASASGGSGASRFHAAAAATGGGSSDFSPGAGSTSSSSTAEGGAWLPGIRSLLQQAAAAGAGPSKKLEAGSSGLLPVAVYSSPARAQCAAMCQWPAATDKRDVFEAILARLELDGQFERAAALAVFHGDLRRATTALTRAATRLAAAAAAQQQQQQQGQATAATATAASATPLTTTAVEQQQPQQRAHNNTSSSSSTSGSSELTLRMVAMALAGCGASAGRAAAATGGAESAAAWGPAPLGVGASSSSSAAAAARVASLWRETWQQVQEAEPRLHPYLRAAFAFLADLPVAAAAGGGGGVSSGGSAAAVAAAAGPDAAAAALLLLRSPSASLLGAAAVLHDAHLLLSDRVAFACRFLDDRELDAWLAASEAAVIARGAVEGVLLTGLDSPAAVDLFERYVDLTADIQTAALALCQSRRPKDQRLVRWMYLYRRLLDNWQLWYERAAFDIAMGLPFAPQVYVRCNFCSQSLQLSQLQTQRRSAHSHGLLLAGRASSRALPPSSSSSMTPAGPGGSSGGASASTAGSPSGSQKVMVTSCPHCKKPLPRCSICLLSMSVQLGTLPGRGARFDDWFTWCQNCRHSGHAGHLQLWFETHTECPVAGCECRCASL